MRCEALGNPCCSDGRIALECGSRYRSYIHIAATTIESCGIKKSEANVGARRQSASGFGNSPIPRQPLPMLGRCLAWDAFHESRTMYNPRFYTNVSGITLGALRLVATWCALVTLAACGGGGANSADSAPPTTPPSVAAADAARFLEQATFGVTASDVAHVQSVGISASITEQLALPPTQYTGFSYTPHTAPASCKSDGSKIGRAHV
jgi:hypothetical protein